MTVKRYSKPFDFERYQRDNAVASADTISMDDAEVKLTLHLLDPTNRATKQTKSHVFKSDKRKVSPKQILRDNAIYHVIGKDSRGKPLLRFTSEMMNGTVPDYEICNTYESRPHYSKSEHNTVVKRKKPAPLQEQVSIRKAERLEAERLVKLQKLTTQKATQNAKRREQRRQKRKTEMLKKKEYAIEKANQKLAAKSKKNTVVNSKRTRVVLSETDARAIYFDDRPFGDITCQYGISEMTIRRIKQGIHQFTLDLPPLI